MRKLRESQASTAGGNPGGGVAAAGCGDDGAVTANGGDGSLGFQRNKHDW